MRSITPSYHTRLVILLTDAPLSMRRHIKSKLFFISATFNAVHPNYNIRSIRDGKAVLVDGSICHLRYVKFEWRRIAHTKAI